jgi:hypothetical protein
VIVLGHRVFRVVKLAHAGCADSQIVEVGVAGMRAVVGELTAAAASAATSQPGGR